MAQLAHAATRVVATRRAEVIQAEAGEKVDERRAFYEFLAEMDAESDGWKKDGRENGVNLAGTYEDEMEGSQCREWLPRDDAARG